MPKIDPSRTHWDTTYVAWDVGGFIKRVAKTTRAAVAKRIGFEAGSLTITCQKGETNLTLFKALHQIFAPQLRLTPEQIKSLHIIHKTKRSFHGEPVLEAARQFDERHPETRLKSKLTGNSAEGGKAGLAKTEKPVAAKAPAAPPKHAPVSMTRPVREQIAFLARTKHLDKTKLELVVQNLIDGYHPDKIRAHYVWADVDQYWTFMEAAWEVIPPGKKYEKPSSLEPITILADTLQEIPLSAPAPTTITSSGLDPDAATRPAGAILKDLALFTRSTEARVDDISLRIRSVNEAAPPKPAVILPTVEETEHMVLINAIAKVASERNTLAFRLSQAQAREALLNEQLREKDRLVAAAKLETEEWRKIADEAMAAMDNPLSRAPDVPASNRNGNGPGQHHEPSPARQNVMELVRKHGLPTLAEEIRSLPNC